MIVIIDYGAGNLRSVQKAIEQLGFEAQVSSNPEKIKSASGIILPGVGSFDSSMIEIRNKGLEEAIKEVVKQNKPFLGICLGYQLLFEKSEEGKEKGLGILKGDVKKFTKGIVPHMGWNRLIAKQNTSFLKDIPDESMVYFAHSYYVEPKDRDVIMTETDYTINFASSVCKDNLFGIQFHPEKSSKVGLIMLKNFMGIATNV